MFSFFKLQEASCVRNGNGIKRVFDVMPDDEYIEMVFYFDKQNCMLKYLTTFIYDEYIEML